MIISSARPDCVQQTLFDTRRVGSMGHARVLVGDLCEQMTAERSGAVRLKTDSRADICPDLHLPPDRYLESKAVGQSRRVIVYTHRLDKDREFVDTHGAKLEYWIWRHDADVTKLLKTTESAEAFQAAVRQRMKSVIVLPFDVLEGRLRLYKPRQLHTGREGSYGSTGGYRTGWDIPLGLLLPFATQVMSM